MNIAVVTTQPFNGVIHTRDFRKGSCLMSGDGRLNTSLTISLLAKPDDPNFCGVHKLKGSEERTVALTVRVHKTLELSEDKYYIITCSQSGFRNDRNELSRVSLKFLDNGLKVVRVVHGNQYTLRAEISSHTDDFNLVIRNCFSFIANSSEVELIDANGCPKVNLISGFTYNDSHYAEATIYSMFKFPDVNKVNFQCDVILCKSNCPQLQCNSDTIKKDNDFELSTIKDSIQLLASTTVFVIEPGDQISESYLEECTEWRFPWLITLCIVLAIMLLVMLLVNIFLCSSLSCSCIGNNVDEKESSEIEDYDPYKIDWTRSSHYGSHSSLNKNNYTGYVSGGGSTIASHRSVSGNDSDPYGPTSHSRPNSRYSNKPSQTANLSQTYVKY
ncbi:uncharacterized protein LOC128965696 [Oppia nitens]|uniref:uncharacterized protein LOC128965696 n=1 Tax=Oppia nitens TaxID=1686743 RepID=UPI0023DC4990|nr:uncharacterized protein LOC128965696 [Oppia nitens]